MLAIGPGRLLENGQTVPVSVKVGDRVWFTKYGGHHVDRDGVDLMLIRDSDLLAVM